MKAVLISIRPKWCEKIVNGEKNIEVRKTRPKLQTPFKCYIYCTMDHPYISVSCGKLDKLNYRTNTVGRCNGKVIGEFTCDRIYEIRKRGIPENFDYCYLSLNEWGNDDIEAEIKAISASCVSKEELNAYGAKAPLLYGWHISNLKIYDTLKELSAFYRTCPGLNDVGMCWACDKAVGEEHDCGVNGEVHLSRPPQSWCYVYENN